MRSGPFCKRSGNGVLHCSLLCSHIAAAATAACFCAAAARMIIIRMIHRQPQPLPPQPYYHSTFLIHLTCLSGSYYVGAAKWFGGHLFR